MVMVMVMVMLTPSLSKALWGTVFVAFFTFSPQAFAMEKEEEEIVFDQKPNKKGRNVTWAELPSKNPNNSTVLSDFQRDQLGPSTRKIVSPQPLPASLRGFNLSKYIIDKPDEILE